MTEPNREAAKPTPTPRPGEAAEMVYQECVARLEAANATIAALESQLAAAEARAEDAERNYKALREFYDMNPNSMYSRMEQAEADAGRLRDIAEKLWEKVNEWRCRLIQWKHAGDMSPRDLDELAQLQSLADEYIRVMAPLPINALEEYMRERGIEIPEPPSLDEGGARSDCGAADAGAESEETK